MVLTLVLCVDWVSENALRVEGTEERFFVRAGQLGRRQLVEESLLLSCELVFHSCPSAIMLELNARSILLSLFRSRLISDMVDLFNDILFLRNLHMNSLKRINRS